MNERVETWVRSPSERDYQLSMSRLFNLNRSRNFWKVLVEVWTNMVKWTHKQNKYLEHRKGPAFCNLNNTSGCVIARKIKSISVTAELSMKDGPIQFLLLRFLTLIIHALGFLFHKAKDATLDLGFNLLLIFQLFVICFFPHHFCHGLFLTLLCLWNTRIVIVKTDCTRISHCLYNSWWTVPCQWKKRTPVVRSQNQAGIRCTAFAHATGQECRLF